MEARIIITTINRERAYSLAREIVEKKLAACANILPISSIYWWKGKIEDDEECMIILKTSSSKIRGLKDYLLNIHPYETPEIIEIEPNYVADKYLSWLIDSIAG